MTESGTVCHEGEALAGAAATAASLAVCTAVVTCSPDELLSPPRHPPAVVRLTGLHTAVVPFASGLRGTRAANVADRLVGRAQR